MTWSLTQVIRGAQLAWLGSVLAFQNQNLYKHGFMKIYLFLAVVSITLYFVTSTFLAIPLKLLHFLIYLFSFVFKYDHSKFTENYLWVTNYVLNLPFLGLLLMRYLYPQSLDSVFMESLHYVDIIYIQKHTNEQDLRPPYTPALERYEYNINYWDELRQYLIRTGNQIAWVMMLYFLSLIPMIGALVYPIASAYALVNSLGYTPAFIVGILMYVTPGTKPFAMIFLEILYSSRALMRELLEPYFGRIKFDKEIKKKWFKEREGILFGFSIGYYSLIRLPLVGMLFYGIAQAAATLLLVKICCGLHKLFAVVFTMLPTGLRGQDLSIESSNGNFKWNITNKFSPFKLQST
ncbi:9467_t:CDS:2 [Dentiscutata erythropus]|uniref:9467_t:CDS:1 n=1 Tax=Dentiscutata erythropus TaxID=1348616 RepID=A0A9N9HK58_9GLOM|nr:9467_t:CDS:2 [Dentiscutata erythropus]